MEAVNMGWLCELLLSVHVSQIVPGPCFTMYLIQTHKVTSHT